MTHTYMTKPSSDKPNLSAGLLGSASNARNWRNGFLQSSKFRPSVVPMNSWTLSLRRAARSTSQ